MLQERGDTHTREMRGKGRTVEAPCVGKGSTVLCVAQGRLNELRWMQVKFALGSQEPAGTDSSLGPMPSYLIEQVFKQWVRVWCKDFKALSPSKSLWLYKLGDRWVCLPY